MKLFVICAVLLVWSVTSSHAQTGSCLCGWFVETMWGQLSNLEPLDYLPGTTVATQCGLTACQDHCQIEGEKAQGTDLNEIVSPGKTRGQTYCEQIYQLLPSDVNNEPLFVLSRVPDCDTFFVWGTTHVYTSSTTFLCCSGGNYSPC